jgi:hypothetical protein
MILTKQEQARGISGSQERVTIFQGGGGERDQQFQQCVSHAVITCVLQKNDPHKYQACLQLSQYCVCYCKTWQSHRFSRMLVVTTLLKDCTVPSSGWSSPSRVAVWQDTCTYDRGLANRGGGDVRDTDQWFSVRVKLPTKRSGDSCVVQ